MSASRRPGAITLLAVADVVLAIGYAFWVPNATTLLCGCSCGRVQCRDIVVLTGLALALAHIAAAVGLLLGQRWGRGLQLVVTCIDLLLPCWTLGAAVYLLYLRRPAVRALFSRDPAPEPGAGEQTRLPAPVLAAIAGMLVLVALAPLAAIFPALIDCRTLRNEAATIGDIRTLVAAEAAYQRANGGYYDVPACLAAPERCIPGYRGPALIDEYLARAQVKSAYTRMFHNGPPVRTEGVSPSSMRTFAYVAVPGTPGQAGCRAFCGDSAGTICATPHGSTPSATGGLCDLRTCEALR